MKNCVKKTEDKIMKLVKGKAKMTKMPKVYKVEAKLKKLIKGK